MDRDRGRDGDRGDRRDDRYSNTYRPRSPGPRVDSYRGARSPPRGRGVLAADTYTPGGRPAGRPRSRSPGFRRRSRSPRPRDDGDRWRARPRSPPRRAFSPRRDDFRADRGRSPRGGRMGYDSYTRSPRPRDPRDRSPLPLDRERDISPARSSAMRPGRGDSVPRGRGRYDEPRSRAQSPYRRPYSPPRGNQYRRPSRSPRRDRAEPYTADTWRRPSVSPARPAYGSNDVSGRQSAASSRRSSPPVHASRASLLPDAAPMREPAPRSPYRERDEPERDYPRDREVPMRPRETPPTGPRSDRDREYGTGAAPPTGPSSYRNGDGFNRAPPTGPSARSYPSPAAISPPAGPSHSHHPPAYPRSSNPALGAPTRPRGGYRGGFGGDSYRDFPPPRRGSWGGGGGGRGYHGGPPPGPPSGPRGGGAPFAPPFRGSSNSTSTTYPRTLRFTNHLADLPKEIPGGQKLPELYDRSKIDRLEEEARKLREVIDAKEAQKRQSLREWDNLEREANNAALRADLAEQQLRALNGEGETGGAAF
ncbi:hypothetical protein GQ43DRAFT_16206 [Delitschia confertaspora ATCC 74209]|uniref:Uncharacterized protein n=1 Tax=Delitschia confertaspora ATCC 74209 TaxID=1513339 RepID=A0A9P4JZL3_9PLEO|nr:hypothetical protein GQ43DRAFT_16206 [Delitschia confertaspora ATCC 74209]